MRRFQLGSLLRIFLIIVSFLMVIAFPLLWELPVNAQETVPVPTVAYTNGKQQLLAPDWSRITWGNLPPIQEPGWIQIPVNLVSKLGYDPSRIWNVGETPDSVVMLGDVAEAFHLEAFTLEDISGLTSLAMESLHLDDFGLTNWQSPNSLARAIPGLKELPVSQVKPVADLVIKLTGEGAWDKKITDVAADRILGNAELGKYLDLSKYKLSDIPGLTKTPLGKFAGWQQSRIDQVPWLNRVPFTQFPQSIPTGIGIVGIADIVWSEAEHGDPSVGANYFVSGSAKKNVTTAPVPCTTGEPCAYLELSDPVGSDGPMHGKRWVSGGSQQVKGGFGILSKVNNGWEPTGRLVYGPAFKVVLTKTNETTGTVDFGLYLRFCSRGIVDLGCSPYFIGPIPWIPVQEKGAVIVAGISAPRVNVPSKYKEQLDQLRQQYEPPASTSEGGEIAFDDCGGTVKGDAVDRAIAAVPADMRSYANKPIPLILAAAKKYGVTDPAQVAYILSTVQTETTMGANLIEGATRNKSAPGSVYYGRGLVQLTGEENYRKASRRVGIDLVKNPDLAAEPEIAAKILVVGMRDGLFTGRKLSDFIGNGKADFVGARQIVNDSDKAQAMARDAQRYLAAIQGTSIADLKDTGAACSTAIRSGSIQQRISQAATQSYGMSSRSGPGGGNVACAWAVNRVLNKAGIPTIGSNPNLVFSVRDALEAGRGQQINRSQAVAGDLVLALGPGSRQHIGICQNNGCTQVLSNSSSRASFSWKSDTDFAGYYGVPSKIYRVVK